MQERLPLQRAIGIGRYKSDIGALIAVESFDEEAIGGWSKSRVSNVLKYT